jgi:hypothetical protein
MVDVISLVDDVGWYSMKDMILVVDIVVVDIVDTVLVDWDGNDFHLLLLLHPSNERMWIASLFGNDP